MAITGTAVSWRREQPGLMVVFAALGVIAVVVALWLDYRRDAAVAQIRVQGVGLARVLSGMDVSQLAPEARQTGPLSVLRHWDGNRRLAYAAVTDTVGRTLMEVTAPGVIIPEASGVEPRLREQTITLASGRAAIEFRAPLLAEDELAAQLRVAFFEPALLPSYDDLPFLATLALPIFLMAPLFYWLLRREIKPLAQASEAMRESLDGGFAPRMDIEATGPLADFMHRFNEFAKAAESRIKELETGRSELITSAKLIGYKNSRIETVLKSLPDGVLILDEEGRVNYANEKVPLLLGVSMETITSTPPESWMTYPEIIDIIASHRSTGGPTLTDTISFRPNDDNARTLACNSYPLFSPRDAGVQLGTLIVIRDATEEALAKQGRAEFVAHVAHELKTPLNTLNLYSEMLLDSGDDAELRAEAVNVIRDEVERIGALVGNLLNITRIEMGSLDIAKTRVRLGDLLEDIFENVSRSARGKDLKLNLEVPRGLPPVAVDKDLLRVAINNLLSNAVKYNSPQGSLTLSATETEDEVVISVADTGVGIADEDKGKIFDRFVRGQSAQVAQQGGHGLGLALTKDIVDLHEGTLRVESEPGQGSTFSIVLRKNTGLLREAI